MTVLEQMRRTRLDTMSIVEAKLREDKPDIVVEVEGRESITLISEVNRVEEYKRKLESRK